MGVCGFGAAGTSRAQRARFGLVAIRGPFQLQARVPESNRGKGRDPPEGLNKVNKKMGGGRRMPTGRGIARAAPKMRLKMSLFPLRDLFAMRDVL